MIRLRIQECEFLNQIMILLIWIQKSRESNYWRDQRTEEDVQINLMFLL